MHGFVDNIEQATKANENFRKVLYTAKHSQLVLMALKPGEDIGEEVHNLDQFLRIEQGIGQALLDGIKHELTEGSAIVVPASTRHNVINLGTNPLKLYTIYSPPEHQDGAVRPTKAAAQAQPEHFDGQTTE